MSKFTFSNHTFFKLSQIPCGPIWPWPYFTPHSVGLGAGGTTCDIEVGRPTLRSVRGSGSRKQVQENKHSKSGLAQNTDSKYTPNLNYYRLISTRGNDIPNNNFLLFLKHWHNLPNPEPGPERVIKSIQFFSDFFLHWVRCYTPKSSLTTYKFPTFFFFFARALYLTFIYKSPPPDSLKVLLVFRWLNRNKRHRQSAKF